jgi:DNA-binding Lrp family transcriptional regulator
VTIDGLDRRLLDLLRADGRARYAALGAQLHLSPAAVKRRMQRLREAGVIRGYTAIVDESAAGRGLQAFVELRFTGVSSSGDIEALAATVDEVQAVFTTAGDPDALAWVHVADIAELRRVVDTLRASPAVRSTKTLIVVADWQRGA